MDKTIRFTKMMQKAVDYYRKIHADNEVIATLEDSYILRCIIVDWAMDNLDPKSFSDLVTK